MLDLSLKEQLKILKNIMLSSPVSIIALLLIVFIGFLFITTNRHNKEESKRLYILLYITCIAALIIKYASLLSSLFDYFMNHVFTLIYFPNLAIYFLAIIITNIIMWKSMFQSDNKAVKGINTVAFCIIHYLFILLLTTISKNGLNIFDSISIYQNKEAFSLIELSSATFILWILFSMIYFVIQKVLKNKELVLDEIPEESRYNLNSSKPYITVEVPHQVLAIKKEKEKSIQAEKDAELALYESMLTVEDYKLLLDLLKKNRHQTEIKDSDLEEPYRTNEFQTLYGKSK